MPPRLWSHFAMDSPRMARSARLPTRSALTAAVINLFSTIHAPEGPAA